jgi:PASTA domain
MTRRALVVLLLLVLVSTATNSQQMSFQFSGTVSASSGMYSSIAAGTPITGTITLNYANAVLSESNLPANLLTVDSWVAQAYSTTQSSLAPVVTITASAGGFSFSSALPAGSFGSYSYVGDGLFSCHYPPEASEGSCGLLPPASEETFNATVLQLSAYEQPIAEADFSIADITDETGVGPNNLGNPVFTSQGFPYLPRGVSYPGNLNSPIYAGGDFISGANNGEYPTPTNEVVYGISSITPNLAPFVVPNVVGDTQAAASAAISNAGLAVGTTTEQASATVAAGVVISEDPAAETQVQSGSAVSLTVSSGPPMSVHVPDVVGQTETAASSAVKAAGLSIGTVTQQSSSSVSSGDVITQNPAAGTAVMAGSAVNLTVSTGAARSGSGSGGGGGQMDWVTVTALLAVLLSRFYLAFAVRIEGGWGRPAHISS